jgi:hypothetical protein
LKGYKERRIGAAVQPCSLKLCNQEMFKCNPYQNADFSVECSYAT